MWNSIWRYSHLFLAVSSSLFLLLATLTGIILGFEPIQTQYKYSSGEDISSISLSEFVPKIKSEYDEIFELKRDENNLIIASVMQMDNDIDGEFILDAETGKIKSNVPSQSEFFEFITSLHRSLFLKSTGRWLVGINAVFLFFIVLSGVFLIIKRQQNWKKFFSKIIRIDFPSYAHTFLGRWMLIPLAVVALSAVLLFLIRFEYLSFTNTETKIIEKNQIEQKLELDEFSVFKNTYLSDFKSLEFPFSEDEEDFFILKLNTKTLQIHQYSGEIIEQENLSKNDIIYDWSLFFHTGKGSVLWSVVLILSGFSVLYFIFSGTQMASRRLRRRVKNKFKADEAEIIILYGSENGSTKQFASHFFQSLIKGKQKAYINTLNAYNKFEKATHLVILTSTYGKGEAPANATKFLKEFEKNPIQPDVKYAVVGFGSTQYPDFCEFAKNVNIYIQNSVNLIEITPIKLINNQSVIGFRNWWEEWLKATKIDVEIPEKIGLVKPKLSSFELVDKKVLEDEFGYTFLMKIKPKNKRSTFESGDLLAVFPPNEEVERFYSIGKVEKNHILLSVKKHEFGKCSNFLDSLELKNTFNAYIKSNTEFHLSDDAKSLTFIANGTGIAPFLGMIKSTSPKEKYLYFGVRNKNALTLYEERIKTEYLTDYQLVFSRENQERKYVQDIIKPDAKLLLKRLEKGGILMICGSLAMQKDVIYILNQKAEELNLANCDFYLQNGQLKLDSY